MVPSESDEVEVKFAVRSEVVKLKLAVGGTAKAGLTGNVARQRKTSVNDSTKLFFIWSLADGGYRFFGISH